MPHYDLPKYVTPPLDLAITLDTPVDLIFLDFYAYKTYATSDVQGWGADAPLITNGIYEAFVKEAWGADKKT
ncbi:hypothetical protein FRC07_003772 [Ceratobasidium sp. 392]|nr:hypothetical protein FRC07_003772 [Ceratobasidium sp. 392]